MARSIEAAGSSSQATLLGSPPTVTAAAEVTAPAPEEPVPSLEIGEVGIDEDFELTQDVGLVGVSRAPVLGRADFQLVPLGTSSCCSHELQDQEHDALPSMETPTLVRFAVPSSVPVDQRIVPGLPGRAQPISTDLVATTPGDAPSPITWRPAEDVLPTDLPVMLSPVLAPATKEQNKVYARRPKAVVQQTPHVPPPGTPPSTAAARSFIEQISKPVDTALSIPIVKQQRQRKVYGGIEPPRRSRRVAKLPPEILQNPSANSVCRELGFTDANSKVTPAMVEKYNVFFKTPLKRTK